MKEPEDKQLESKRSAALAEHERERILFNLRHTTPLQRLEWLEEAIRLLSPYLRKK